MCFDRNTFLLDIFALGSIEAAIKRHRNLWGGGRPFTPEWRYVTGCSATTKTSLYSEACIARQESQLLSLKLEEISKRF